MGISIGYSRTAASTKAFALIAEGWNELVQDGLTPDLIGTCPVCANSEVLYAYSRDGDCIGVLAWQHHKVLDVYEVTLGYVEPSSRKQRVFAEMFAALVQRARSETVATINVPIHPDNAVAKAVLEKLQGQVATVVYEHAVA